MLALICAGSFGVCAHAEEVSEHLMTSVSGTQISGYVSTSMSWRAYPVTSLQETTVPFQIRELRAPAYERPIPFNPLNYVPTRLDGPQTIPPLSSYQPRARGGYVFAPPVPRTPNSYVLSTVDQTRFQLAAVPEPTTIGLTATGLLAWLLRRSRKR